MIVAAANPFMSQDHTLNVNVAVESWPLKAPFVIARGAKTEANVVVVTIADENGAFGRGECVPYARYGETPETVATTIAGWQPSKNRIDLLETLPAGAARNAIDCALWDLEANQSGTSVANLLNLAPPQSIETALTLSLASPDDMANAAANAGAHNLLKLKLGSADNDDMARMRAVRSARPGARLIVDANEGWAEQDLVQLLCTAADVGVETVEQPLPSDADTILATIEHPVSICADESHHTHEDLPNLVSKYDGVNIKLDKAGGLTAAMDCVTAAQAFGFEIMVGSMVATSLAVAPAYHLTGAAQWVDLDGPLLMAKDRDQGFQFHNGRISPSDPGLWGVPQQTNTAKV